MYEITIEPNKGTRQYWTDVWRYRELFAFLVWRDIMVRYKQTVIGIAWSLLRPAATMLVFTLVFGRLAKLPSQGYPYPLLVFSALLPWQFFANALSESSGSLVNNASMISKVYFPRLIIPASSVMVALVDFLISSVLLGLLMAYYGQAPSLRLLAVPVFTGLAVGAAFGTGLLLSALTVRYRDFRFIVPFLVQLGLYVSPVGFMTNVVPQRWRDLFALNPMVGIIDGFRWAVLGTDFNAAALATSAAVVAVLLTAGFTYFRKTERSFADVI